MKNTVKNFILSHPRVFKFVSQTLKYVLVVKNFFRKDTYKDIYYISPKKIQKSYGKYINIYSGKHHIIEDDIVGKDLSEYSVYESFKEHFDKQVPWEDTKYYLENIEKIQRGEERWGCKTIEDFEKRCEGLDALYQDIKNNGFIRNPDKKSMGLDEICVVVGPSGEYYLINGKHRHTISLLLGVESIPVRIIGRHKKWISVIKNIKKNLNGFSYQDFDHEDLDANIIVKRDGNIRFKQITEKLPFDIQKGDIFLDIGGNIGSISRKFEINYATKNYITEIEDTYVNILNILKKVFGYKYKIIKGDVLEWEEVTNYNFTGVIGLSIFHHFIKTESLFIKFKEFLNKLDTEMIIFEPHNVNEVQMQGSFKNFGPKEFVEFIKKETGLDKVIELGSSEKKSRELFIIYK